MKLLLLAIVGTALLAGCTAPGSAPPADDTLESASINPSAGSVAAPPLELPAPPTHTPLTSAPGLLVTEESLSADARTRTLTLRVANVGATNVSAVAVTVRSFDADGHMVDDEVVDAGAIAAGASIRLDVILDFATAPGDLVYETAAHPK